MIKRKILWLDLNASYSHSSLSLPMIQAQDIDCEIDWQVVFATLSSDVTSIVSEIVGLNPEIIVSTAWLFTHDKLHQIISRVKSIMPNVYVVYGGPEFMGDNREYLRIHTYINCVVRGEGEEVFYQLMRSIDDGSKWRDIDGLCGFVGDEYLDNGTAKVLDFAKLRYPETSRFFRIDRPFVQMETTRGCFNGCAFCVSGNDKPIRTISMTEVRERLQFFADNGIREIRVLDRTFNYSKSRTSDFFAIFRDFSDRLCFHLEIHPALLSDEMCEELRTIPSGLLHLEAGVQSLNDEVLKASNRVGMREQVVKGLKFLCELDNMECHADLIIGLPLYTLEQIYLDVRELIGFGVSEVQLESLKLLPGTPLRNNAEKFGICYSRLSPYEVLCTPAISVSEIGVAMVLSKMLDNFYNHSMYQAVVSELVYNEPCFLSEFTAFLVGKLDLPLTPSSRGELLYSFCEEHHPAYLPEITVAWIKNGLSMKKRVAHGAQSYHGSLPNDIKTTSGNLTDVTRLYIVNYDDCELYFGFNRQIEHSCSVFTAKRCGVART